MSDHGRESALNEALHALVLRNLEGGFRRGRKIDGSM